jgi:hypothetical protein
VPLDLIDWVVDPTRRCVVGNYEQRGEQKIEI